MAVAIAGAAIAIGGAIGSMFSSSRARRSQRRQQAVQRRIRESQIRRERQAQLRQAQQARAGAEAMSAMTGTLDSSGYAGVRSAIGSTLAGNLALSGDMTVGANLMQYHGNRAAGYMGHAQTYGAISQIGSTMMGMGAKAPTDPTGDFGGGANVSTGQQFGVQSGGWALV